MNAMTSALKKKLHPTADKASKLRALVGDRNFPSHADKMITDIKRKRESRANDKALGY